MIRGKALWGFLAFLVVVAALVVWLVFQGRANAARAEWVDAGDELVSALDDASESVVLSSQVLSVAEGAGFEGSELTSASDSLTLLEDRIAGVLAAAPMVASGEQVVVSEHSQSGLVVAESAQSGSTRSMDTFVLAEGICEEVECPSTEMITDWVDELVGLVGDVDLATEGLSVAVDAHVLGQADAELVVATEANDTAVSASLVLLEESEGKVLDDSSRLALKELVDETRTEVEALMESLDREDVGSLRSATDRIAGLTSVLDDGQQLVVESVAAWEAEEARKSAQYVSGNAGVSTGGAAAPSTIGGDVSSSWSGWGSSSGGGSSPAWGNSSSGSTSGGWSGGSGGAGSSGGSSGGGSSSGSTGGGGSSGGSGSGSSGGSSGGDGWTKPPGDVEMCWEADLGSPGLGQMVPC